MNSRILIALVVLIGLGVAVTVTLRSRASKTTLDKPTVTFTAPKKEELSELEILKPKQEPIVLKKVDGKWRMTAPVDAPVAQTAVDSAVEKLSELSLSGVAATRKENQEKLEVDAAHGIHVKAKAGDKPVLDFYIGKSKSGGTLIRREGEDETLIAKGSWRYVFDKEPKELRKKEITELDTAELTAFAVQSPKGSFKFVKNGDAWAQAPGEKPIAKFEPTQVQGLASAASNLRATDFAAPGDGVDVTGLDAPSTKLTLTKKDGKVVEVSIGKPSAHGDDAYVRVTDDPVVYRLAKYSVDRLSPEAKAFEKPPAPPPAPPQPQGEMPSMLGGPGGGQITPEMMKQIQENLQKAQAGHP